MDVTTTTVLGSLLLALLAVATSSGLPADEGRLDEASLAAEKRPKYMDTRQEDFEMVKQTVLIAMEELVQEGKLNPSVLAGGQGSKPVEKRMYMGICMRQSHNHFIPDPCMRSGRK
uniref:Whitnin n=1 Tax=Haliotis discus hannai TaxID=42344 RepID=A0A8F5VTS6_HALDH|nr:whitnin [Haliotis discus hannai]